MAVDFLALIAKAVPVAAGRLAEEIRSRSPNALLEEARSRTIEETNQIAYMVTRAIVAVVLRRDPLDEEIDRFFEESIADRSFFPRFGRLFAEAVKSPTDERRRLLLAALLGLPKVTPSVDERDRMDAAIERFFSGGRHPADRRVAGRRDRRAGVTRSSLLSGS